MGKNCGDDHIIMNKNNNNNNNNNGYQWTNERHSNFLSSMEASFVRNMFENKCLNINENNINNVEINNNNNNFNMSCNSRLDRFVPDIAESTLDLHSRKFTTPGIVRGLDQVMSYGSSQRQRPPHGRPYKSSHDQVGLLSPL
ncbi:hypothetical protein RND81_14G118500 [Saponaria officinalis]|uniref:Uncharacterized protein n=1 Tax=Saponaria officinalis TaxID=3572 RepID=A0AAW1GL38_SAPOF